MAKKKEPEATLEDKLMTSIELKSTYNPLLVALQKNDKKNMFQTNVNTVFHKTGFHLFDAYFGSTINIHNELGEIIKQEARMGQAAGTFNLMIGNTGSGKTTWSIQLAANIIRQFQYANVIHYDCEQRMDISRCETVSRLPSHFFESGRYILKSGMVGMDTIQAMIVKTAVEKMALKDEMMVSSGQKDEFGKDIMIFQPTVILLDSITSIMSETFSPTNAKEAADAEKMRGNTEGARDAKSIKGFFKDILPLCKEANIIIYAINHINTNMSMNSFVPVAKQQNFLKQDESIPGGKTMLYYPFNIIKLTAKPSDDYTEDSDGFAGHTVMVEPIKSSSNQSGNNSKGVAFNQVFSFKHGMDALRTIIMYAKDRGLIEGNKTRYKFRDDQNCTFTFKNVHKEIYEKPEIIANLKQYVFPLLEDHLSFVDPADTKFNDMLMEY